MNKPRLLEILQLHPWQTRGALVKLCADEIVGIDDHGPFISGLLAELIEAGSVTKTGRARGTRYAVAGAAPHKQPEITTEQRDAVLAAVDGGASRSAEIVKVSGVDIDLARQILRQLVTVGLIERTGYTKSTRYWPKGSAPKVDSPAAEPSPVTKKAPPRMGKQRRPRAAAPPTTDQESEIEGEDEKPTPPPKVDPLVALRRVIEGLPRRTVSRRKGQEIDSNVYALDDLARMVEDKFGVARYEISVLIQDHVLGKMGDDHRLGSDVVIHAQMRYEYQRKHPGWCAYVWRPAKNDDPRPETYEPIGSQR